MELFENHRFITFSWGRVLYKHIHNYSMALFPILHLVSVPDPKPTPAQIVFSIARVILEAIYMPDEVWRRDYSTPWLLSLAVQAAWRRPGSISHVMCATDISIVPWLLFYGSLLLGTTATLWAGDNRDVGSSNTCSTAWFNFRNIWKTWWMILVPVFWYNLWVV